MLPLSVFRVRKRTPLGAQLQKFYSSQKRRRVAPKVMGIPIQAAPAMGNRLIAAARNLKWRRTGPGSSKGRRGGRSRGMKRLMRGKVSIGRLRSRILASVNCIFRFKGIHKATMINTCNVNLYNAQFYDNSAGNVVTSVPGPSFAHVSGAIGAATRMPSTLYSNPGVGEVRFTGGNYICFNMNLPTGGMDINYNNMQPSTGANYTMKFGMEIEDTFAQNEYTGLQSDIDSTGLALSGARFVNNTRPIKCIYTFKYQYIFRFHNESNMPHVVHMVRFKVKKDMRDEADLWFGMGNYINFYQQLVSSGSSYQNYIEGRKFPPWMDVKKKRTFKLDGVWVAGSSGSSTSYIQKSPGTSANRNHRTITIRSNKNWFRSYKQVTTQSPSTSVIIDIASEMFKDKMEEDTWMLIWAHPESMLSTSRGNADAVVTSFNAGYVKCLIEKESLFGLTQSQVVF